MSSAILKGNLSIKKGTTWQKRDFDQPSGLSDMSPVASGHSVMSRVIIALVFAPSSTIQDSECRVSHNFEPYLLIHDGLGEQTI
jgi:hypothetical protein